MLKSTIVRTVAAVAVLALSGPLVAAEKTKIDFTLDWKLQGVHGWYYLAQDRGYFADEGLEVTIDQGEGSAATVTRIMSGAYDAGFGDMNAIIQNAAERPDETPVMVYQIYNQPPFSVLARADGPVKGVADLAGRRVGGPAGSAATKLFPALANFAGLNPDAVEIVNVAPNLQEQILIQGDVDASLVFNVTSYMNLVAQKRDPDTDFRWFPYGENGLDIYSNGVMVSQKLLREKPEAVAGLVRAINRAMRDVIADPEAGIAAVMQREALLNADVEARRLQFALKNLVVSPETQRLGAGAVDPARLARAIDTITRVYELPTRPAAAKVYSDAFLPPLEQRSL